jgi:hypothetical protein
MTFRRMERPASALDGAVTSERTGLTSDSREGVISQ